MVFVGLPKTRGFIRAAIEIQLVVCILLTSEHQGSLHPASGRLAVFILSHGVLISLCSSCHRLCSSALPVEVLSWPSTTHPNNQQATS